MCTLITLSTMPRTWTFDRLKRVAHFNSFSTAQFNIKLSGSATKGAFTAKALRWSMTFTSPTNVTGQVQHGWWAIVRLRNGDTLSTIALNDGDVPYEPEEDVMACGCFALTGRGASSGPCTFKQEGTSTASRMLHERDEIHFVCKAATSELYDLFAVFQLFVKS